MRALKVFILKFINFLVPKNKNYIYASPISNCKSDKYDLLNYSADSLLSFIRYLLDNYIGTRKHIFLETHFNERIPLYKDAVKDFKNITFTFLKCNSKKGKVKKGNIFKMFRCKTLMFEPIDSCRPYILKRQNTVCLCYFSTFKNDSGTVNYNTIYKDWTFICSTSEIDSKLKSESHYVPFKAFYSVGLTRNDNLFKSSPKKDVEIRQLLTKQYGNDFKKIILYAPTFRDINTDIKNPIMFDGVEELNDFLKDINAILIVKTHPWKDDKYFSNGNTRIVPYIPTFDYSFYDLMKISDVLISDYSSISIDYLLLDKPIIYFMYDIDDYMKMRGLAYKPYEDYCGGQVVYNSKDLVGSIAEALSKDSYKTKRTEVRNIAFKYYDDKTCKRVYDLLVKDRIL